MLSSGDRLADRYRIETLVGRGGTATVYRARDERLDRDVAIKVLLEPLSADPAITARFEREARALTAVSDRVGPASIEWAYDGRHVWLLQLHRSHEQVKDGIVVPGEPKDGWLVFEAGHDLEELRALVAEARLLDKGVLLKGRVGLTSHVGDVLRLAEVPARLSA